MVFPWLMFFVLSIVFNPAREFISNADILEESYGTRLSKSSKKPILQTGYNGLISQSRVVSTGKGVLIDPACMVMISRFRKMLRTLIC